MVAWLRVSMSGGASCWQRYIAEDFLYSIGVTDELGMEHSKNSPSATHFLKDLP